MKLQAVPVLCRLGQRRFKFVIALSSANPILGGLIKGATYRFTDEDTKETFDLTAEELSLNGLPISISTVRGSKLLFYKVL